MFDKWIVMYRIVYRHLYLQWLVNGFRFRHNKIFKMVKPGFFLIIQNVYRSHAVDLDFFIVNCWLWCLIFHNNYMFTYIHIYTLSCIQVIHTVYSVKRRHHHVIAMLFMEDECLNKLKSKSSTTQTLDVEIINFLLFQHSMWKHFFSVIINTECECASNCLSCPIGPRCA